MANIGTGKLTSVSSKAVKTVKNSSTKANSGGGSQRPTTGQQWPRSK